ncbi:MAG: disulfide bond formation protein B [Candidatus Taylorbacteria bacterium]|nr:disulfide bond formation protein B [Candidatus Taylorbacteria bacterium]
MEQFTQYLNLSTSFGTILLLISVICIVGMMIKDRFFSKSSEKSFILDYFKEKSLIIGFLIVSASVLISLIYSEVIGYIPCELCWIQRIFLYPQFVILGLALWKKTRDADLYCLALSIIGTVIAGYHFYGQSIDSSVLPSCDVVGGASCSVRYFVEFGFVTIPMMSVTAFFFLVLLMLLHLRNYNK